LKEFEALAREALGSDEGFAPAEKVMSDEWRVASEGARQADAVGVPDNEAAGNEKRAHAAMEAREELLEETAANNEGMPEARGDESAKSAAAGE